MHLLHIATILICASVIAAEPPKQDNLEAIIPNMRSPEELVCKEIHPAEYLRKLKVNPPKAPLSHMQRYILARHLLDCYHLCDALHHQSFSIPVTAPIMRLAEETFPGFRERVPDRKWLRHSFLLPLLREARRRMESGLTKAMERTTDRCVPHF